MTPLWDSETLRAATGGTVPDGVAATGVSIDTRGLVPGDLFVALRDSRDGHDHVPAAFAAGAACALVDRDVPGGPLLRVPDTLRGLTDLGAAGRARASARVVAVTGSVGKTSTKEMLAAGLAACGTVHAAAASHNNHWGVPLTLSRLPRDADHAVVEVGMNTRGEIAPLSRLARPDVAVITIIAPAHLGRLGSMEAIAEEKADILAGLAPQDGEGGGTAVFPADGEWAALLRRRAEAAGARLLTFGDAADADGRMADWRGDAESQSFRALLPGGDLRVDLPVPGRHMGANALASLLAATVLGADPARFAAGLASFSALAGRGARVRIALPDGEATLLDESYNANTASIRAALAVLAAQPATRRIAVLGDMLELGDAAAAMHAGLAPDTAVADLVFTCGPEMRRLHDAIPANRRGTHAADSATLAPIVAAALRPGDVVLVKGSLGSRMAAVVHAIRTVQGAPA